MAAQRRTHILFDFFGTLVDYSASRTEQGYFRSHALLLRMGSHLDYDSFLDAWTRTNINFDAASDRDDSEYSMREVGTAFLSGTLDRKPTAAEVDAFVAQYLAEWNTGVRYVPEIVNCVHELAQSYRLAVVTNTHQPDLVPHHLANLGLTTVIDVVITSVQVGWRKPHPKIYAAALNALGVSAGDAIFVGDTYGPDFVGAESAGLTAYLIDPSRQSPVPEDRRLASVLDLPARLSVDNDPCMDATTSTQ